jgi:hypothetical protein
VIRFITLSGQISVKRLTGRAYISKASAGKITLQDKIVTPKTEEQVIEHGKGFDGLGIVTVVGDEDFTAENIRLGKNVFGIVGKYAGSFPVFGSASGVAIATPKANATSAVTLTLSVETIAANTTI